MTGEGRARRVTRNSLSLSAAEVLSRFFTWLTLLFLARYWTKDYYGQYAVAVNWVLILGTLTGLGIGTLAVRDVSHDKGLTNFYLRNIIHVRLAASILCVLALALLGPVLHYEAVLCAAMVVMGLRLILDAPSNGYTILLQAHEKMTYQGLVSLGGAFLRMAGIVGVAYLGGRMIQACWVWVAVSALSLAALWAVGRRQGWRVEWEKARWRDSLGILKKSIPFAAFGTFQMLYYRVDGVILKSFAGNEAVALYDMAGRFLFVVFMLSDHFGIATLPVFSSLRDRAGELSRVTTRTLKVLVLSGIPLTVGGYLLANPLMVLLLGSRYAGSGPAFAVLALSIVFYFATKPAVNLLAVLEPGKLTLLFMGMFALNVAANFAAIPHWGLMGAAWVSSFCEVALLALCLWLTRRHFDFSGYGLYRGCVSALAASAVMGMGIHQDPRLYWLALGPAVYGVLLLLLGGVDRNDLNSLGSALKLR